MCGISGIAFSSNRSKEQKQRIVQNMIGVLRHRGPDDTGYYSDDQVELGQSRLSIIDIAGGKQPIYNEDKSVVVIFNGEIFNYIELRKELIKKKHRFYTHSDTEVIAHAYEEYGLDFVSHFNGQFAIAVWDKNKRQLVLVRDRVGIRPLFYAHKPDGTFVFASEIKAIFASSLIRPEMDPAGINQVFTLWCNVPPRTVFKDVCELQPGHMLVISENSVENKAYWKLTFPREGDYEVRPLSYYKSRLQELLYNAVTIRLRADVPVASYLSGGIDSSIISTLVKKHHNNDLITFSVAFSDAGYDEREFQEQMVNHIRTDHRMVEASYDKIGQSFSDVVWYAEKPMLRTAPAPLYILSGLVRENNIKVVLTGEGADEVFGGYNIFKEDKIRRFWAEHPDSKLRPHLLSKLYPYIKKDIDKGNSFWQLFFKKNLQDTDNPYYSHQIRWHSTSQIKRFFTPDRQAGFADKTQIYAELEQYIDNDITGWHPFARAQYLEMRLFMPGYLLSTQGDRMMMGNSVEGRFPFLDHNVIEFAGTIPPQYKMNVLNEKYILKESFRDILPANIVDRDKQPYRAPIYPCFLGNHNSEAEKMLSEEAINSFGYFNSKKVTMLKNKLGSARNGAVSARDDMALVGIVSMQLLHKHFLDTRCWILDT